MVATTASPERSTAQRLDVRVLLTVTTVAGLLGIKFDAIIAAARDGRLRVTSCAMKPSGEFSPLFSVASVARFIAAYGAHYGAMQADYYKKLAGRVLAARLPPELASLDQVLKPRPAKSRPTTRARR